ncbi:T9SS type A sorting domain-containing protein, partial [bacterium]|nr:T9SS type A sorting domain-containing protein [bacterium]
DPSDSNLIIPRGYMKHGRASERLHEFFGGFVFSDGVYYLHSPDSVVRVSSLFVETHPERTRDRHLIGDGGGRSGGFIMSISSDSIYFMGQLVYSADTTHSEPSPFLIAGKLHLHSPPGYDTLEWLGYWCGYDWDFSGVTAIGYSDSMNLLAALTDHYLVLLQPSTNPSDLGRRYFREIGRYRRWKRSAMGYCKLIFDRNYLILCGDDTAYTGITVLRFDSTLSFEVVGYIPGPYRFIAKRGRYVYAYRVCLTGVDIIECLFDSSGVNDGGSYYRHDVEGIDIYPNPVYYGGTINISSRHSIIIYDIRGNVVAKISGGNKAVKLNPAPGIYFAVSNKRGRKAVTKFVVIK